MTLTPQVEIPPKLIIYVAPADADIFEAIFLFEVTTAEFLEAFAQAFKLPVTPFLLLTIRALRELPEAEIHQILMYPYKNLLNRLNRTYDWCSAFCRSLQGSLCSGKDNSCFVKYP